MNEEQVSLALYLAAVDDLQLEVLSWQGVDGKGYFAADIKFRLQNGDRVEPDLILADQSVTWIIEVKPNHQRAIEDESKLIALRNALGDREIIEQIRRRTRGLIIPETVIFVVAFDADNISNSSKCQSEVVHLPWSMIKSRVSENGLNSVLSELRQL